MCLSKLLVATLTIVSCLGLPTEHKFSRHYELDNYSFDDYLKESGKSYDGKEYDTRSKIFKNNLAKIKTHNALEKSWKMGVNRFTDMSDNELKSSFGADKRALYTTTKQPTSVLKGSTKSLPSSIDWRDVENAVSAVKDQGQCGSCWAFAATATIESHVSLNTGILTEISPQELVSCMPNDDSCGGTGGCYGATAELAFDYLAEYGLPELWTYGYLPEVYWNSYTGTNGACLRDQAYVRGSAKQLVAPRAVTGSGYVLLPRNDYDELMNAIATIGPIAVNVDASNWHSYESGVFFGCPQEDVDINHVVTLVGYGTDSDSGEDYWLVRNSWSPEFGELGYIRIARSAGYCGMDYHNGDGVGCSYDPTNVTVCGMCGILYDSSYPIGASLW